MVNSPKNLTDPNPLPSKSSNQAVLVGMEPEPKRDFQIKPG